MPISDDILETPELNNALVVLTSAGFGATADKARKELLALIARCVFAEASLDRYADA